MGSGSFTMLNIGGLFQLLRLPALVRPFRYYDGEVGQVISIKTSPRYTILSVGNKDFFFIRETGKLDGIGERSEPATTDDDCTADCAEQ